ncbi:MAG: tetratricopeptide repeat protein [Desulfobacterales bacterium]
MERKEPPAPWWALTRYGMCQLVLGFPNIALEMFKQALPIAPNMEDEGTTLNNMSTISYARGDYDTALKYLQQSLGIKKGNRMPSAGTTLNNMSTISYARSPVMTLR